MSCLSESLKLLLLKERNNKTTTSSLTMTTNWESLSLNIMISNAHKKLGIIIIRKGV